MIRVAHVITGLDLGGAEMVLLRLLERADGDRFQNSVISLTTRGVIAHRIEGLGIEVSAMGFRGIPSLMTVIPRLSRELRARAPQVVQTWMYHADLVGGLAARLAGIESVAWGLHAGPLPPNGGTWLMRNGLRLGARMSRRVPRAIVCCSKETRDVHIALGYDASKMLVIQNGFDSLPAPADAYQSVRSELGLGPQVRLIGRVGRFHPQKDHETFLTALHRLDTRHEWAGVMVGSGLDRRNEELVEAIERNDLRSKVYLLGEREDVPRLHAAFDVAVSSSSYGEGLPIVVGEAIAMGTPVVTTDVGDSAALVSDPERVVPPRDPEALARAIDLVLRMDPRLVEQVARDERERLLANHGLGAMTTSYAELHESLASG